MKRGRGSARLRGAILGGILAAVVCFPALLAVTNESPVAADGKENLTAALNMIHHGVFSAKSKAGKKPRSDMFREPAWPAWTAGLLLVSGRSGMPLEELATRQQLLFKANNAVFFSLVTGLAAGLAAFWSKRPLAGALIASGVAITTLITTPSLVNKYNNEPLAMLLLLVASALMVGACGGRRAAAIGLGAALGLLALTKAQFLAMGVAMILVLAFVSRRRAGWALLGFVVLVAPWIARNALLFGKPAISERGKTVAAVRLSLVVRHLPSERSCMLYAFTHPAWRPLLGEVLSLQRADFNRGGTCERFCREYKWDMGRPEALCDEPFPEDKAAVASGDWRSAVQYFWNGMAAGRQIEKGRMRLTDIAPPTPRTLGRYILTLPLYAWRGWGFSGSPWLGLALSFSVFALLLSSRWPLAVLAATAHLVHLTLTHNIPRYHAVEFGVMFLAFALLVDQAVGWVEIRLRRQGESGPADDRAHSRAHGCRAPGGSGPPERAPAKRK